VHSICSVLSPLYGDDRFVDKNKLAIKVVNYQVETMIAFLQEIKDYHVLQNLHREAIICNNINEFQLR
jgi:hypothetical protein